VKDGGRRFGLLSHGTPAPWGAFAACPSFLPRFPTRIFASRSASNEKRTMRPTGRVKLACRTQPGAVSQARRSLPPPRCARPPRKSDCNFSNPAARHYPLDTCGPTNLGKLYDRPLRGHNAGVLYKGHAELQANGPTVRYLFLSVTGAILQTKSYRSQAIFMDFPSSGNADMLP